MFERVEISRDAVTDRNLMACEIPRIKYVGWQKLYG